MHLIVELSGDDLRQAEAFARTVQHLVEAIAERNENAMRQDAFPKLYSSGVIYATDPPGVVSLADAPTVLARGWGHCAHLSAYLCAELRLQGLGATIRLRWPLARRNGKRLFHVQVRLDPKHGVGPRGLGQVFDDPSNSQGQILDPSRVLGMGRRHLL
jgi:hypothetical protein